MGGTFGYAGRILKVDLSSSSTSELPTLEYASRFLGGRGIAAKIYWDEVSSEVNPLGPENRIIFVNGPLTGLSGLASSRWEICGKSPATVPEHFSYSNLGGRWGAQLKFAGYDGVVVEGKAPGPVYLLIQDDIFEIRDARALWGRTSIETRDILKSELGSSARVAAIGPAGENLVSIATILADDDSSSCGFGAVMGSKNLKAVVIRGGSKKPLVAWPERLQELVKYAHGLRPDGARDFAKYLFGVAKSTRNMKPQRCYGCMSGCPRARYEAAPGDSGKVMCQAGDFYKRPAVFYYGEKTHVPYHATRLCDRYGLDTMAIEQIMTWLSKCYKAGILSDQNTGIPLSKLGSEEFIDTLVRKISLREGFGEILAQGIHNAAEYVGNGARHLVDYWGDKAGKGADYGPRLFITTGVFYAMEPKRPTAQLHAISRPVIKWKNWLNDLEGAYMSGKVIRAIAKTFWGSELAADFSTYDGKAMAAKIIQDRENVIACLILCNELWPIMDVEHSEEHVGDPALESKLYSAVTGVETGEQELLRTGERVFNLQRAIFIREGCRGKEDDRIGEFSYTLPLEADSFNPECLVPGKDGLPISRKGMVVDRQKFAAMLDEYYELRGWDAATGLQTKSKLKELHLEDVSRDMERRNLVK